MSSAAPLRLTRRGRLVVTLLSTTVLAVSAWAVVTRTLGADPSGTPADAPGSPPVADAPAGDGTASSSPGDPPVPAVVRASPTSGAEHLGEDVASAQVAAVGAVVRSAPAVVVAAEDALLPARGVARRVGVPLVPAEAPGLGDLLDRLGTTTVVVVERAAPAGGSDPPAPAPTFGDRDVRRVPVEGTTVDRGALDGLAVAPAAGDGAPLLVVAADDPARPLLGTLANAVGSRIVLVEDQLAADRAAVAAVRGADGAPWVLVGTADRWDAPARRVLAWDVDVARSGVELPGGGLRWFPGRRLVALYGSPDAASLGVLGEQGVEASIARARDLAAGYAGIDGTPPLASFEIIATVATGAAGPEGDYSRRVPHEQLLPWIEAAGEAGVPVILDLQPGRTDFLTQAQELEPLLRYPHVGLALDPEWRLQPDQVHLVQVGSVAVEEVQAVADWLAELTRREALPQKVLLLHQFRTSMVRDRDQLRAPPEVALTIQMDGQGGQPAKLATWDAITDDPPPDAWFGWKNFYDEDLELRSPADTVGVPGPTPVLVSYQ